MTTTAISAVVPRMRVTLEGRATSVQAYVLPWVRVDVEFSDCTGSIVLRFLGRSVVPGMERGRRLRAEGTPAVVAGSLLMLNPLYTYLPDDGQAG
jgi:hypothetical protein